MSHDITKTDIIMSAAEKLKKEWLEEGMEIGKEKGMGEGMEKGVEKGIFTKAIAVAKNMLLKLKMDIDIVQCTPGEAWLSKRVKFPSGQGIANQPELSVAA